MQKLLAQLCTIALLLGTLCSGILTAAGKPIMGLASWYGEQHQGLKMANGRPFDRFLLTAAHRTYKFGTLLQVCYLKTMRCVVVTVTDRGPGVPTRIIDLSEAAAEAIGLIHPGIGQVSITQIESGSR